MHVVVLGRPERAPGGPGPGSLAGHVLRPWCVTLALWSLRHWISRASNRV